MMMLQIKRYAGFEFLPESFAQLLENAGKSSYFLGRDWFFNFEKTVVSKDEQVIIYSGESNTPSGQPMAILPMKFIQRREGLFHPKTLSGLTNYYSPVFRPLLFCLDADNISEIMNCLSSALWEDKYMWDVLDLSPLPADSSLFHVLIQSLCKRGLPVQTYFCFGNWYLDVAGRSYAEYFDTLPSQLKNNIPYNIRRIQRSHKLKIDIHTDASRMDSALAIYEKLYLARWGRNEPHPDFIPGLAATAAANGSLRLGILYIDDVPAASQLWLVDHRVASIFKTAYDRQFSKFSVGTIMTDALMRHVIDVDKVREVDYLIGDDDYKKLWMPSRRERWGIMAFNPRSIRGLGLAMWHIGGHGVKQLFRRIKTGKVFAPQHGSASTSRFVARV